jgi:hypothetical protein
VSAQILSVGGGLAGIALYLVIRGRYRLTLRWLGGSLEVAPEHQPVQVAARDEREST